MEIICSKFVCFLLLQWLQETINRKWKYALYGNGNVNFWNGNEHLSFFPFQDLLLQMKERCEYMQEVNSLCKDVEQVTSLWQTKLDTEGIAVTSQNGVENGLSDRLNPEEAQGCGSPALGVNSGNTQTSGSTKFDFKQDSSQDVPEINPEKIRSLKLNPNEESHPDNPSEINPEKTQDVGSPKLNPNQPDSPSVINPKLADLATEVKDLNVRFASTCMQAKQHYAALSKVLTASIDRRSSRRSSTRSNRSQIVHYVKVTGISERKSATSSRNSSYTDSSSFQGSFPSLISDTPRRSEEKHRDSPSANPEHLLTTSSPNRKSNSIEGKSGLIQTSKDSVLATNSPSPQARASPSRRISISTSIDIESEISSSSVSEYPVVLRSKSVDDSESYTDNQPRPRRRPKSAVIIEPSADGETALVSEVELRSKGSNHGGGKKVRRRSMEVNLAALSKSGLLSSTNFQVRSPASSPGTTARISNFQVRSPSSSPGTAARISNRNQSRRNKFGSLGILQPGERSSIASVESLEPRTIMLSGQLQHNSAFNVSFGSSHPLSSMTDSVPVKRKGAREAEWNQNLRVENGLESSKRSVSMDTLAINNRNKGLMQYNSS